jgi:hypothetical protein
MVGKYNKNQQYNFLPHRIHMCITRKKIPIVRQMILQIGILPSQTVGFATPGYNNSHIQQQSPNHNNIIKVFFPDNTVLMIF